MYLERLHKLDLEVRQLQMRRGNTGSIFTSLGEAEFSISSLAHYLVPVEKGYEVAAGGVGIFFNQNDGETMLTLRVIKKRNGTIVANSHLQTVSPGVREFPQTHDAASVYLTLMERALSGRCLQIPGN